MARETSTTTPTVTTDTADYPPGAWAEITASGFTAGSTVTFKVDHVSGTGPDGVYGTADDRVKILGGDGHKGWKVTDGGAGDLDGVANGAIVTSWYVNPDDSLNETFRLTARGMYGEVARTSFTDGPPVEASVPQANGTLFQTYVPPSSTGTGTINSFLRIQANGFESGYNTDGSPLAFDTKAGTFTHSINLISIPVVTIDNVQYRQFNIDLNESNSGVDPISLQNFKIYTASSPTLVGLSPALNTFANGSATLRYNLDGGGEVTVTLTDWNTGSGKGDYAILVPNAAFGSALGSDYVYLYAEMGRKGGSGDSSDGGFEEWFVVSAPSPQISIEKFAVILNDGGTIGQIDNANEDIRYTVTVSNTGNVDLTNVVVKDQIESQLATTLGVPGALATGVTLVESGLGTRGNATLEKFEVWTYSFTYNVTAADISAAQATDSEIDNVATATTAQTSPTTASAFVAVVPIPPQPAIEVDKTAGTVQDLDGNGVDAGDTITYTYQITNTGDVSLRNVVLSDDKLGALSLAGLTGLSDEDGDGQADDLAVGASVTATATATLTQAQVNAGSLTNVATATGTPQVGAPVSDDDTVTVTFPPVNSGLIAPTSTTAQQYIKGPAFYDTFQEYYETSPGANNGVVQYGIKSGNINQTNPGVFFYFTGASGQLVSSGTGTMSIVVDQTVTTTDTLAAGKTAQDYSFLPTFQNIVLYRVNDLNANGMVDGADTLSSVRLRSGNVTFGAGADYGDITVSFNGGAAGTMYVLSVKYGTGTVVGQPGATLPTFDYTYATKLGSSATVLESGELSMAAKPAMMLDGEAGDGARSVSKSQVSHVLKQAMAYWEGQGISDEQVAMLKNASVEISNIGGTVLAQSDTSQRMITIDNDGAGHGWSLGIGAVAPTKVDLFSVLVHEMGHLLGESDEEMGNLLAVGERTLPQSASSSDSLPLPASILGVVGTEPGQPETHFG